MDAHAPLGAAQQGGFFIGAEIVAVAHGQHVEDGIEQLELFAVVGSVI